MPKTEPPAIKSDEVVSKTNPASKTEDKGGIAPSRFKLYTMTKKSSSNLRINPETKEALAPTKSDTEIF